MVPSSSSLPSLRCAAVTRSARVDPIGTAGCYAGFLLLEWPLPWPHDIGDVPDLAPVVAALRDTGIRLQGVVPSLRSGGARRVARYRRSEIDQATGYQRIERIVPAAQIVEAALDLLAADPDLSAHTAGGASQEVLVCTHGRRDVCCGSLGTALALEAATDRQLREATRVLRTSHTGGHRFAPTAIVLPQGTAWAYLDADALTRIVRRTGALADLLPRYRGCTALTSPAVQALEREAFAEVGWDWLNYRRHGVVLPDQRVRLEARSPDGRSHWWEARVEVRRSLPVPECGRPADESRKQESELLVTDVTRK